MRRQQAEATRRALAAAARRLFAERGYAATTIEEIAREAGVAVQTFYAVYGSKRGVLFALLDAIEADADLAGYLESLREAAGDPWRQLERIVDFNVRLFDGAADVLRTVRQAGSAEVDPASVWREGEERRRLGQVELVRDWAERGVLRPGLPESEAADVLWALTGPDVYRLFVDERGWPAARYRGWLTRTLASLLFGGPADGG
ncbi:MAG TPA: TetR/AcrR family transcriptional regulator [Longimicrobiales bacterium]